MLKIIRKFFPSYNDKKIKIYEETVEKINKIEEKFSDFNEENFLEKTKFFKEELKN
jgi:preprotein translocase subunit SecA